MASPAPLEREPRDERELPDLFLDGALPRDELPLPDEVPDRFDRPCEALERPLDARFLACVLG
jgi:hypothetical protein